MSDLSLIQTEELIKEVENRCVSFVAAYETFKDKDSHGMEFVYGKGEWADAVKLASILNNTVLMNWKGELQKLQELNNEDVEDGE